MEQVDCVRPSVCQAGQCTGPLPAGSLCTMGGQCVSGHCVKGVCCQTACVGACRSCGQPGSLGVCTPVRAGEDPENDCAVEPQSGCGKDGACDGRGGCRLYAAGEECGGAACSGGTEQAVTTCDGSGACRPAETRQCDPYACAGAFCGTTCTFASECSANSRCAGSTCVAEAAPSTDLGVGLVGYWRFDDGQGSTSVRDSSGNGNHGVLRNLDPAAVWAGGQSGGGLDFAGKGFVKVPRSASIDGIATGVTIAVWVYKRPSSLGTILGRQYRTTPAEQYVLSFSAPWTTLYLANYAPYPASAASAVMTVVPDLKWAHLAASYDGATARIYIDGKLMAQNSRSVPLTSDTRPVTIGGNTDVANEDVASFLLNGILDEVMLYGRALAAAEIARLAAGGRPPPR